MNIKMHAPSQQFGFVEIEGGVDDIPEMEKLYNKYSENRIEFNKLGNFKEFDTFTGEKILYDDEQHLYTDVNGNKLISGSEYAKSVIKPFDLELLSGKVATKYDIPQDEVKKMWAASGNLSASFGTCLHAAVENWFLFKNYGTEKQYHLPKPKFLREAVESYPHLDKNIIPEVLVSDVKSGRCGRIDQLEIVDENEKICNIYDIKSDSDISKNIKKHTIQLQFYKTVLENMGWFVSRLSVDNFTDKWVTYDIENKRI